MVLQLRKPLVSWGTSWKQLLLFCFFRFQWNVRKSVREYSKPCYKIPPISYEEKTVSDSWRQLIQMRLHSAWGTIANGCEAVEIYKLPSKCITMPSKGVMPLRVDGRLLGQRSVVPKYIPSHVVLREPTVRPSTIKRRKHTRAMPPRPSATSVHVRWTPTPSISSSTSPRNAKPTCPSSSSSSRPRTKSSTPAKPSGKRGATKAPSATFASLRCFFWDAAWTQCSTRWWSKRARSFMTLWSRTSSTRTTTSLSKRWWECAGWPLSATKPSTWWKRTAISSWTWTTWCINSWSQPPNLDGGTSRDTSSTADPFGTCAASGTCPETFTPRASTHRFAPALGTCSQRTLRSSSTRLPCTPDSCIWRTFTWGCVWGSWAFTRIRTVASITGKWPTVFAGTVESLPYTRSPLRRCIASGTTWPARSISSVSRRCLRMCICAPF